MNLTLAWLNLLGDVRQLPFLGIYVIMFFDILKTFMQFGLVFVIFIVAFGLGFHLLLIEQVITGIPQLVRFFGPQQTALLEKPY